MYKLYGSNGSCSMAVHAVLEEVGAAYEYCRIDTMAGQQRSPEFLKINSRGQVPVLVEGDFVLREGCAILIHLCEKHNSVLLPKSGPERATALEWLAFCNSTLHPAFGRCFALRRLQVDEATKNLLAENFVSSINALLADVENRLEKTAYLAGEQPTVGDYLLAVILNWSPAMPLPVQIGPRTKALLQKISALPAFSRAMAAEQVTYKVAA